MTKLIRVFVIFLLVSISYSQESTDQKSTADESEKKILEPIPVTEITSRADETLISLNKILADTEPIASVTTIEEDLPKTLDSLETLHANPRLKELENLNVRMLQNLSQEWSLYSKQLDRWKETLQSRSQDLEKLSHNLKEMTDIWKLTEENAVNEKAPRAIRERVKSTLKEISTIDKKVSPRLNTVLVLQNKISNVQIKINDLLSKIKITEQETRNQLFVIDSPTLWEAFQADSDSLQFSWIFLYQE